MKMHNVFYAEFLKLRGHPATIWLVLIYPMLSAIANISMIGNEIFAGNDDSISLLPNDWIIYTTTIFYLPLGAIGFQVRWLFAFFAAVAIAGEYGWNTWKLVVPARERWQLIVAKWVVIVLMLSAALLVADLIMLGSALVSPILGGRAIPSGVTAEAVFIGHATGFSYSIVPIIYTVAWAGLLGVLTRSPLFSAFLSVVIITLEQFHVFIAIKASALSSGMARVALEVLPFYHSANLLSFLQSGMLRSVSLAELGEYSTNWQFSLAILMGWIFGLGVMTLLCFQNQDIN